MPSRTYEPLAIEARPNITTGTLELRLTTAIGWVEGFVVFDVDQAEDFASQVTAALRTLIIARHNQTIGHTH